MFTATQIIKQAVIEKTKVIVVYKTPKFVGYSIHLKNMDRPTTIRVHVNGKENKILEALQ